MNLQFAPQITQGTATFGEVMDLGDGYIARKIWHIEPRNADMLNSDMAAKGQASNLNTKWNPKLTAATYSANYNGQFQRCPSVWVDNILLLKNPQDPEPSILFGEWCKTSDVYGHMQEIHGLALAGGGHYERMGQRPTSFLEGGDMSLISCADKELYEETMIPREACKKTYAIGWVDDVFNDPRTHGIRFVFMRWVSGITPQSTDELKKLVAIPISMVKTMCETKAQINVRPGEPLGIILNHDKFLLRLFKLPDVQQFISKVQSGWNDDVNQMPTVGIRTF